MLPHPPPNLNTTNLPNIHPMQFQMIELCNQIEPNEFINPQTQSSVSELNISFSCPYVVK